MLVLSFSRSAGNDARLWNEHSILYSRKGNPPHRILRIVLASAYFSEADSDDVGHDSFKSADPGHLEATRPP